MRTVALLMMVLLAGCVNPEVTAQGTCAHAHQLGDDLVVHWSPPDAQTYDQWTLPDWSDYDLVIQRYDSNGEALWTGQDSIEAGCSSSPLSGAGDYWLTANAPVAEDSSCVFTSYEGFSYNGTGILELERQIGAICA